MSDNAELQDRFNKGLPIPEKVYMVDVVNDKLKISRPGVYDFTGSKLQAIPNDQTGYSIIEVSGQDIGIKGGEFIGDRAEHTGTTGEWGHCIKLKGCSNVVIRELVCRDAWGDGIYFGGANGVTIKNVECTNNRRQGCSIVSGQNISISGCTFTNTHGTLPEDGIDIEPDKDDIVKDVMIQGCAFKNNKGAHIEIAGKRGSVTKITISHNVFDGKSMPLKVGGIPGASKYQPSFLTRIRGFFGDYTGYIKELNI